MQKGKLLSAGIPAPIFETKGVWGEHVNLEAMEGSLVWVIFYRYLGCPVCSLHLKSVVSRFESLSSKSLKVVAIFDTPKEEFEGHFRPPFPLVSDPTRAIFQEYRTETSYLRVLSLGSAKSFFHSIFKGERQGRFTGRPDQMPAHFFLLQDGSIGWTHYGKHIGDHPDWKKVEAWVDQKSQNKKGQTKKRSSN